MTLGLDKVTQGCLETWNVRVPRSRILSRTQEKVAHGLWPQTQVLCRKTEGGKSLRHQEWLGSFKDKTGTGDAAQVVESLPSMDKSPGSISSTT